MPNGTSHTQCKTCYYYEESWSHCRHDPPKLFKSATWEDSSWPSVQGTNWCGKHSDLHVVGGDSDESG